MAHRKDKYVDHKLVRYTPLHAIRDVFGFVARFFSITNLKHGFRSVLSGFREFAIFFFAITLVQLLFWCPVLSMETRATAMKEEAYAAADYHILIDGMTNVDWSEYYNANFSITDTYDPEDRLYSSYTVDSYFNEYGEELYSIKILLNEESSRAANEFLILFPVIGEHAEVEISPRVDYGDDIDRMHAAFLPVIIVLGLIGVVILLILYNIRINHYKFRYGVYMSFGADFEKLFQTSAWELIAITLLTFIPAFLISVLAITASFGFLPTIVFGDFIRAIVWDLIVVMLAVYPSVKFLATRTPTSLIVAGDNSNYVSSPRVSFRIFRKSFPLHYELFGFWRFRRYYAILLISAIIFSSVFICGFFIDSMVSAAEDTRKPDFIVSTKAGGSVDDLIIDSIADIDGVDRVLWESSTSATSISAHVLMTSRQRSGIADKTIKSISGLYADNNYKYSLIDDRLYKQVTKEGGWKIEGDLSKVLSGTQYVAVSEYINNTESLNFKVGDKITLAILETISAPIDYNNPDNKYILRQLLNEGIYNYLTVEIAAIIDTNDTDSRYTIAMSDELYNQIVGRSPVRSSVSVYASDDLDYSETEALYESIRAEMSVLDNVKIEKTYDLMDSNIKSSTSFSHSVILCAVFILLISPPVWIFSQSMFGEKRRLENTMLSAFGATDKDLSNLYLFSGASLSVPAIVATAILGLAVSGSIYWIVNVFLTSLGMGADFRYNYEFSLLGLLLSIIISLVSSIASTYLPFLKWKRERDMIAKRHLGE